MTQTQTQTTDIETAPFEDCLELIKTEKRGNFVICTRDKTHWIAIGNYRISEYNTNREYLIKMIDDYGQIMLNIAAALIQINEELNNKQQKQQKQ